MVHSGRTQCPVCGRVMARVAKLNEHMKAEHPNVPTPPRGDRKSPLDVVGYI